MTPLIRKWFVELRQSGQRRFSRVHAAVCQIAQIGPRPLFGHAQGLHGQIGWATQSRFSWHKLLRARTISVRTALRNGRIVCYQNGRPELGNWKQFPWRDSSPEGVNQMPVFGDDGGRRAKEKQARAEGRLPPGQSLTLKWPVLHYGTVPHFDPSKWDFPNPSVKAVVAVFGNREAN